MKNLLLTFGFIFATQLAFAQYFTVTPNGFISEKKEQFVIIEIPDQKQEVLYKNVLNALSTMYSNPKEALSLVEGQTITITAYETDVIIDKVKLSPIQIGLSTLKYDLSYTISIQFKDGKIRYNSPAFECRRWTKNAYDQGRVSGWTTLPLVKTKGVKWAIFDKNGKIISPDAYDGLNKHFNSLIAEIIRKSNTSNNW